MGSFICKLIRISISVCLAAVVAMCGVFSVLNLFTGGGCLVSVVLAGLGVLFWLLFLFFSSECFMGDEK